MAFLLLLAACGGTAHPFVGQARSVGQALVVCDAGLTLQGADVSSYQGAIDWTQAAGAGLAFSIAKATEGLTLEDPEFSANWSGMKGAGVVRGAYHFLHPDDGDGAAQADFFLSAVGAFEPGDLPPFLDWETDCNDQGGNCASAAAAIGVAQAFIDEIQAKTGLATIIYTYPYYWASLGDTSQFAANPVWFANYGTSCPDIPSPWTNWLFWQDTSSGAVAGMDCSSGCDLDEFNGTLAQLQSIGVQADGGPIAGADGGADAGALADAGEVDAGVEADAGAVADAGGSGTDAGPKADGGERIDGGARPDAGKGDAGAPSAPAPEAKPGCGCGAGGGDPAWLLAGIAALLAKRRRR